MWPLIRQVLTEQGEALCCLPKSVTWVFSTATVVHRRQCQATPVLEGSGVSSLACS